MRCAKHIAATIAAASLATSVLLSPAPALAASAGDTGTTEVTVQAGPGWGQKTETVEVARGSGGRLAQTGDTAAAWAPVLLLGAAALSGGLLAAKESDDGKGDSDDIQA